MLRELLQHPLTRDLAPDDPRTTALRKRIVREKSFLRQLYEDWYDAILANLPSVPGTVVELGSGAGFLAERIPDLVTSEVFNASGVRVILDARSLPFAPASLRAIVMTDVLHHVPAPARFLDEAARTLVPGGRIVMIEPWVTPWSRFVYGNFHPEPFRPEDSSWSFPGSGPLSGANGAMPWMIFERDRALFEREYPLLRIVRIELMMPFRYLLSGGVSMRSLAPGWLYPVCRGVERLLAPLNRGLAMFALAIVERSAVPTRAAA